MSLLLFDKESERDQSDFHNFFKPKTFDASKFIIPYSTLSEEYIYMGDEKIPFKQRESEFQLILRKEFADSIKKL